MAISKETARLYTRFLHEELIPAMGCTEPIALAYGAAYARRLLGKVPQKYTVECSGNIIKNVMAVTVPQTGGMRASRQRPWWAPWAAIPTWSWKCCPQ